ncbi:MAG: ribonuclease HI, partial [Spirochaeta sp.]|nr:ribonuclease HI [Spirochaeta sp.]
LDELNARLKPAWEWVKGHAGDDHNEACDRMVQEVIRTHR